ncbi:MAG: galactokinase [Nocardioides sp.]
MSLVEPGTTAQLSERVSDAFTRLFGRPATVVGRAPGRVNLIGEHTDYNGGLCLPVALPHATYAASAIRDDGVLRIASAGFDEAWEGPLSELTAGSVTGWAAYAAGVVWALAEDGLRVPGLDVLLDSTVPVGGGLSSSAAVECAVAVAVAALAGARLDDDLRHRLLAACIRAESEMAGAPTGGMDQAIALFAAPDTALLLDFGTDSQVAVPLPLDGSGVVLLVINTGVSHALSDGGYGDRRAECDRAAVLLEVSSLSEAPGWDTLADDVLVRRTRHILTENDRVRAVVSSLDAGDWAEVGRTFAESHASMRDDFEISCAELDVAVDAAVQAGALGARMTGGGFGGSAVALVPEERVDAVRRAVDTAYAGQGWKAPTYLEVMPSTAASAL